VARLAINWSARSGTEFDLNIAPIMPRLIRKYERWAGDDAASRNAAMPSRFGALRDHGSGLQPNMKAPPGLEPVSHSRATRQIKAMHVLGTVWMAADRHGSNATLPVRGRASLEQMPASQF
jgi:hypothetical protein